VFKSYLGPKQKTFKEHSDISQTNQNEGTQKKH
jgi:hypothetical protein